MDAKAPLIFLFAGEPSGDDRGAEMARALKALCPNARLIGVPGPKMRNEGVSSIVPMEKFQVMGFIDVFFALPRIYRLFKQVKKAILKASPDAIITIDYPGFNLRLAKSLSKLNHPAKRIHYVCPSVWAWGKKRIPLMADIFDHLITILPFEQKHFASTNLPITYAGNPLTHNTQKAEPENLLAIFPGSRTKEIQRNLPIQLKAAKLTGYPIVISCASKNKLPLIKSLAQGTPITLKPLIQRASLALATSGTITLELALAGIPTVVTYAITPLDTFLATKIFRINMPYYALPNIIAGKEIFPEHFGPTCTLPQITKSLTRITENPATYRNLCHTVSAALGPPPTHHTLASPILDLLGG
jgi:lipid-A-disaccharide synthase